MPKRGSDLPCPTCGKKFVGFDVETGIVYLCPRCRTPEKFEEDLHKLTFQEIGIDNKLTDKKSGKILLRWKVDDERRLVLYSLPDPEDPRTKDALSALTLFFDIAKAGAGGYEMLDIDEHRRDITRPRSSTSSRR